MMRSPSPDVGNPDDRKVRAVEIVNEIPKTPSGKVLRRVLADRERSAAALASGQPRRRPFRCRYGRSAGR